MEPSLSNELTAVLRGLQQTLQQMRLSIEDTRRQPVTGGFASSFSNVPGNFLNTLYTSKLYDPERFSIQPRITFTDLLYTAWRGVPMFRPYVTPTEQLQAQGIYSTLMGSQAFGLAGQIIGGALTFVNPLLGLSVSAATAGIQGLYTNYIARFPEVERTRQVLSPHFSDMTRTGYKGMTLTEAYRLNQAIIDLSLESASYGVGELRDLTARIARTNLLAGVRTVEDFKTRMKQLMNSLREITGALHISYEDAVSLVSQLSRHGFSPDKASQFSYMTRNIAAGLGVNAGALTSNIVQSAETFYQTGLTYPASINLATLGPSLFATLKTFLPAEEFKKLEVTGKQEELLQAFNQSAMKLISENNFQYALLGAGEIGLGAWSTDYYTLLQKGMEVVANKPILTNQKARMAEVGKILERSPETFLAVAKQLIETRSQIFSALGTSPEEASRTATQEVLGITQPELAETIYKSLDVVKPWQLPVSVASINEMAERERQQDKLLYNQQDFLAQRAKRIATILNIFSPNWVGWRRLSERAWANMSWANAGVSTDYINSFITGMIGTADVVTAPFQNNSNSLMVRFFGPGVWQEKATAKQLDQVAKTYNLDISGEKMLDVLKQYKITEGQQVNASVASFISYLTTTEIIEELTKKLNLSPEKKVELGVGEYAAMGIDSKVISSAIGDIEKQLNQGLNVKITSEIRIDKAQWSELTQEQKQILAALKLVYTNQQQIPNANTVAGKISALETTLVETLTAQGIPKQIAQEFVRTSVQKNPQYFSNIDLNDIDSVSNVVKQMVEDYKKNLLPKLEKFSKMNYSEVDKYLSSLDLSQDLLESAAILTGPSPDIYSFQTIAQKKGLSADKISDVIQLALTNPNFARYIAEKNDWFLLTNGQVVPFNFSNIDFSNTRGIETHQRELRRGIAEAFGTLDEGKAEYVNQLVIKGWKAGSGFAWFGDRFEDLRPYLSRGDAYALSITPPEVKAVAALVANKYRNNNRITLEDVEATIEDILKNKSEAAETLKNIDLARELRRNENFSKIFVGVAGLLTSVPLQTITQNGMLATPTVRSDEAWRKLREFVGVPVAKFEPMPSNKELQRLYSSIEQASVFADPNIQRTIVHQAITRINDNVFTQNFPNKTKSQIEDYIINNILAPKPSDFSQLISHLDSNSRATKDLTSQMNRLNSNLENLNKNLERALAMNPSGGESSQRERADLVRGLFSPKK